MKPELEASYAGTVWQPVVEDMVKAAKNFTPDEHFSIVLSSRKSRLASEDRLRLYLFGAPEDYQAGAGAGANRYHLSIATNHLAGKSLDWASGQFSEVGFSLNFGEALFRMDTEELSIEQLPLAITLALDVMGKVFGLNKTWIIDPLPGSALEDRLMSNPKLALFGSHGLRLRGTGLSLSLKADDVLGFFGFQRVE
jgi:hypothetical protein